MAESGHFKRTAMSVFGVIVGHWSDLSRSVRYVADPKRSSIRLDNFSTIAARLQNVCF